MIEKSTLFVYLFINGSVVLIFQFIWEFGHSKTFFQGFFFFKGRPSRIAVERRLFFPTFGGTFFVGFHFGSHCFLPRLGGTSSSGSNFNPFSFFVATAASF